MEAIGFSASLHYSPLPGKECEKALDMTMTVKWSNGELTSLYAISRYKTDPKMSKKSKHTIFPSSKVKNGAKMIKNDQKMSILEIIF